MEKNGGTTPPAEDKVKVNLHIFYNRFIIVYKMQYCR